MNCSKYSFRFFSFPEQLLTSVLYHLFKKIQIIIYKMTEKRSWSYNQLLFFLANYRFSDFFAANTSKVACDINSL